jgi:hypothetical protein
MKRLGLPAITFLSLLYAVPGRAPAAELKLFFPLGRSAYQTKERLEIAVIRTDTKPLAAGDLTLQLQGEDAGRLTFTFPVKAATPARAVEHLYVNARLLRPGKYTLAVSCDGTTASAPVEVYSHLRRSSFRLINWVQRQGALLPLGEDNLGYNLYYGQAGGDRQGNLIRAGVDYMSNCTMSGGHQMDLRMECDWSDPLVIRGGARRVVREAMYDRTLPNVPGVHFYDEPGLTWHKDSVTGKDTPQGIPSQVRSYESAFGAPPPDYRKVNAKDPEQFRRWAQWARWKLGFMDAAWQDAQFGVRAVRPDYLSVTQSQYGFSAFADGYYFNVVRSLPVISGHGGYHDFGPGYFNPSLFLEFARARDLARPNWYLPTWYGNTTPDEFRLEQYLSFQNDIQGMMSPPDLDPGDPSKSKAAAGIVASNKLMGRLGTIFTTMPPTRPPVGLLYSLSQFIHAQAVDQDVNYGHQTPHGKNVMFTYLAGKLIQQPMQVVLDEDVRDGTLAANQKAVILTSLDYLDPEVIAGLEDFAKRGGLVLLTADCKVQVKGSVRLGVAPKFPDAARVAELEKAKNYQEMGKLTDLRHSLAGARPLADVLRTELSKAGIKPVFTCDQPGIVATRQVAGDVEYLFAVNATHDPQGNPQLGMKAVTATITLEDYDRPVYDAIHGGAVKEFQRKGKQFQGQFRFGPGQMRVFARTPVGWVVFEKPGPSLEEQRKRFCRVRTSTPVLHRDYTQDHEPLSLEVSAAVLDLNAGQGLTQFHTQNGTTALSGSIPLRVRLVDPLGVVRYDLYRATDRGGLRLNLPLGLDDPTGEWTVRVTDLLDNSENTATFNYPAVPTCNIAAGTPRRAVYLAQDRANVFRFFREHYKVTVVKGAGDYDAAAQRLVKILNPWNVEATVVKAADVNKPRPLSAEEALTWAGLNPSKAQPGDKNDPSVVGFVVQGPVILLGTPEDNPLIKSLLDWKFLPYVPKSGEFPGPGRGMVAWQRDGIGVGQESITLIAHDPQGMAEAVGTMYEMLAGIEPLTPWVLARHSEVVPASRSRKEPQAAVAWSDVLPDGIDHIKAEGGKLQVLTHAGVLAEIQPGGKVARQQILEGSAYQQAAQSLAAAPNLAAVAEAQKRVGPWRVVKLVAAHDGRTAVAYWGGRVEIFDKGGLRAARSLPQDVTALAWSGRELVVGDADGRLVALNVP